MLFFCNKTNVINTYDSLLRLAKLYDNRWYKCNYKR
jgi:hypothetical protein